MQVLKPFAVTERAVARTTILLGLASAAVLVAACATGVEPEPAIFVPPVEDATASVDASTKPAPKADAARPEEPEEEPVGRDAGPDARPSIVDAGSDVRGNVTADASPTIDAKPDAPLPDPTGDCLVISEYVESSSAKAIELWNCGTNPIALGNYMLCLESNAATTCTAHIALSTTLAAGGVYVVCAPSFANAACDVSSSVVNFNGNDRVAVFRDANHNTTIERGTDPVVDSFGRLGANPPSGVAASSMDFPWEETDLRRSTCTPYVGGGDFDVATYYTASASTNLTNLGVAPAITCP